MLPTGEILVLGAFVVTAGTLLIQGLTLPTLARRLRIRGPDEREDALAEATVLMRAVEAGRAELDRITTPDDDEEILRVLRSRGETRLNRVWERLGRTDGDDETPGEQYRRLRMAMLAAEREAVVDIRDHGNTDSEVLSEIMDDLDVEESMIDRRRGQGRIGGRQDPDHADRNGRGVRRPGRGADGRHTEQRRRAVSIACARAPDGCTCGCV